MVLFVIQEVEVVHLEMNESDVAMVLEKLKDVETHIRKFSNGEQNTWCTSLVLERQCSFFSSININDIFTSLM